MAYRKIIRFAIGIVALIALLPFTRDVIVNEYHLFLLKREMTQYKHPIDSRLVKIISTVGNFAPNSNRCDFVVMEIRTSKSSSEDIINFYNSNDNISIIFPADENDMENFKNQYLELYERILDAMKDKTNSYFVIANNIDYQPNSDIRCH